MLTRKETILHISNFLWLIILSCLNWKMGWCPQEEIKLQELVSNLFMMNVYFYTLHITGSAFRKNRAVYCNKKLSCIVCSCVAPFCLADLALRAWTLGKKQCEDAEILLKGIYVQTGGWCVGSELCYQLLLLRDIHRESMPDGTLAIAGLSAFVGSRS